MLTRSLADWRSQYDRMLRSYARLQKAVPSSGDGSVAYDDDVLHFFMDCWHLKDWIKNDTNLPRTLKDPIQQDVHAEGILQIARNLVNGWKHYVPVGVDVTKKDVTWEFGTSVVEVHHEVTLDDGTVHVLQDVARASVIAWDAILSRHGLL